MFHRCKACGVVFEGEYDQAIANHKAVWHSLSPKPREFETWGQQSEVIRFEQDTSSRVPIWI